MWSANFLSATTVAAIAVLFWLALKAHSRAAAIFAAIIASFSFKLIFDSRWLSNPTPMLLLSMLLVLCMFLILNKKNWAWIPLAFISGTSLFHFGSSGEFFYFPALAIFALWQRKSLNLKIIIYSVAAFLVTALPLILFDLKNNYLLANNIHEFLFEKETFKQSFWEVVPLRVEFYKSVFSSRIFQNQEPPILVILFILFLCFLVYLPRLIKNKEIKTVILLFLAPIVGLLFFQGNEGNVYDYYLTGYYLVFVFLVAVTLGELWKSFAGKLFVLFFFGVFLFQNMRLTGIKLNDGLTGENTIALGNQKEAIEWIYEDAGGVNFNVDVYVPPVIPYAYDYLFTWYPETTRLRGASDSQSIAEHVRLLYTLYEVDPPHPERLDAWHARQAGIGKIEYEARFGGLTVQRRQRLD